MDYQLQLNKKETPTILITSLGSLTNHYKLKKVQLDDTNIPVLQILQKNNFYIKNTTTSLANIIINHMFLNPNMSIKKIIITCNNQPSATAKKGTCYFYEEVINNLFEDLKTIKEQLITAYHELNNITTENNNIKSIIINLSDLNKKIKVCPQHIFYKIILKAEYLRVDVKHLAFKLLETINNNITELNLTTSTDIIFDITHGLKWQGIATYIAMLTATNQALLTEILKQNNIKKPEIKWNPFIYIQTAQKDTQIGFINHIDSLTKEFSIATANKFLYEQFNLDVVLQSTLNTLLIIPSIGKNKKTQLQEIFKDLLNNWQLNLLFPFEKESRRLLTLLNKFNFTEKDDLLSYQLLDFIKLLKNITPDYSPTNIRPKNILVFLKNLVEKRLKLVQYLLTHNNPAKGFLILKETLLDTKILLYLHAEHNLLTTYITCLTEYILNHINSPQESNIEQIKQDIIDRLINKRLAMFLFQEKYKAKEFNNEKINISNDKIKNVLREIISLREIIKLSPYTIKNNFNIDKLNNKLMDMNCTKIKAIITQILETLETDNKSKYIIEVLNIIENKIHNMNIRNSIAHIGYINIYDMNNNFILSPSDTEFITTQIKELLDIIEKL